MRPGEREELERPMRELWARGDVGRADEEALSVDGAEFMRLLGSLLPDPEQTREA